MSVIGDGKLGLSQWLKNSNIQSSSFTCPLQMRTTMIGDEHDNSGGVGEEKSMRAELKGERFVTHVNLSENSTMTTTTTTSVSHIYSYRRK